MIAKLSISRLPGLQSPSHSVPTFIPVSLGNHSLLRFISCLKSTSKWSQVFQRSSQWLWLTQKVSCRRLTFLLCPTAMGKKHFHSAPTCELFHMSGAQVGSGLRITLSFSNHSLKSFKVCVCLA